MPKKQKKPAMQKKNQAHPGLELDAKGKAIPMAKRLPEDREKVKRASERRKHPSSK